MKAPGKVRRFFRIKNVRTGFGTHVLVVEKSLTEFRPWKAGRE